MSQSFQKEKFETDPLKEFADFLQSILELLNEYESGKISRNECLERLLPMMEASDFRGNPYYSSEMH